MRNSPLNNALIVCGVMARELAEAGRPVRVIDRRSHFSKYELDGALTRTGHTPLDQDAING
jgi:hypothetical protein